MPSWIQRVAKKWNGNSVRGGLPGRTANRLRHFQPRVEILEDRLTPTTSINSFSFSPSIVTLPQAVNFSASVSGNTLVFFTDFFYDIQADTGAIVASGSSGIVGGSTTITGSFTAVAGIHNYTFYVAGEYDSNTAQQNFGPIDCGLSSTTISSSLNPSLTGQPVTFTAVVASSVPSGATPTGTVTFTGGSSTQTVNLANGMASYTDSSLNSSSSPYTIIATYNGDSNYLTSSASLAQDVLGAPTSLTLTDSAASVVFGQPDVFTATVASLVSTAPLPTGTVTFRDTTSGATSGPVAVSGTTAAWVETMNSANAVANHTITATFTPTAGSGLASSTAPPVIVTVNKADTTTTLVASPNPANLGGGVTLTATVTSNLPGTGTPGGTVTFYNNGIPLGTGTLGGGGSATITTGAGTVPNLPGGTDSLTATYNGNNDYNTSSTSVPVSEVVQQGPSTASLTSSENPANTGDAVTFTVLIAGVTRGALPTGTVTFMDGTTTLGTGTLVPGAGLSVATLTTNTLTAGTHPITAVYAGDTNYTGSTSNVVSEVVNQATSTPVLTASPNPANTGDAVTFTATLTGVNGLPLPTGTVTFMDGTTSLGTGTLVPGTGQSTATLTTNTLTAGSHPITAVYAGDTDYTGSTSLVVNEVINQSPITTTTFLASSVNPSMFGQVITFTATVSAASGTPIGTVTFEDTTTNQSLGQATLASGVASVTVSSLVATTGDAIEADYLGSGAFQASSATLNQGVDESATTTTLATSGTPSVVGQPVSFTATVAAVAPGAGTPTGTVQFTINGSAGPIVGNATLASDGTATFIDSVLTPGNYTVTAAYQTDGNFASSTSAPVKQAVNAASTTTALSSSENPAALGDNVTFTATITVNSPGALGPAMNAADTVTFMNGTSTLGTGTITQTATGATAAFSTTALPLGDDSITAIFSGDSNYNTSTSSAFTETIVAGPTTTTLSSSANPSVFGQPVTFTATVTAGNAPTPPTGTVFFLDGTTQIGTGTLSGGDATFTTSTLTVGTHSITARYGGNTTFATSTSTAVSEVINQSSTTTTLGTSGTPSVFGQSVTLTATVAAVAPGAGTPTGVVVFSEGTTTLGSASLTGNTATFAVSTLTVGTHNIIATYVGDSNFKASNSTTLTQIVNTDSTTTTVTSSLNPANFGNAVTFTATIAPVSPGGGTPTGTVQFMDGTTVLQTVTLVNGVASTTPNSALTIGTHTITAVYSGDGNFTTSTSTALTETVEGAQTTTTLTSSANPSVTGQAITLTAGVAFSGLGTASGTPTGTIKFMEGSTVLGTVTLNPSAVATLTINPTGGSHAYTAVYSGDSAFATSTSATLTQQVTLGNTMTTLTSSGSPAVVGASVTFTATVAPVSPAAGTPTGTVTFMDGTTVLGTGTLTNGTATFSTTSLSQGNHSITATYSGDTSFNGSSTTTSLTQMITLVPFIFTR